MSLPQNCVSRIEEWHDQGRVGRLQALVEADNLEHRRYRDENKGYNRCEVAELQRGGQTQQIRRI
jgi:hypothetical protein